MDDKIKEILDLIDGLRTMTGDRTEYHHYEVQYAFNLLRIKVKALSVKPQEN